ncbi:MAG TPA: hypothetical protein VFV05_08795 [Methylomirabilota bacterium]|nr:hypothetical protein [Methylomirabilota bacterium]
MRYTQHLREAAAAARDLAREARERGGPGAEEAAEALEAKAADVERLADAIEAALTGERIDRTIPTMNVDTKGRPPAVKAAVARSRRKHPAQEALYRAGITITALAAALGETRARVSAWMAEGEANRPVPVHVADRLAAGVVVAGATVRIPRTSWRRIAE